MFRMFSGLKHPQVAGLPVHSTFNDLQVILELLQSKQPVVIGWLVSWGNAEPSVVWIKGLIHGMACQTAVAATITIRFLAMILANPTQPLLRKSAERICIIT